jgi:hypothetical protein
MSNLPLVTVTWADAWGNKSDEVTLEDVASTHIPQMVTTVGWLLLDDAEGVSIANERYGSTYRGRTFIPRAMVRSITPVIKPRKSKVTPT